MTVQLVYMTAMWVIGGILMGLLRPRQSDQSARRFLLTVFETTCVIVGVKYADNRMSTAS
jgi:hypothetical protein